MPCASMPGVLEIAVLTEDGERWVRPAAEILTALAAEQLPAAWSGDPVDAIVLRPLTWHRRLGS